MTTLTKQQEIEAIIVDIFKLDKPRIDQNRCDKVSNFITSTVNGDDPIAHLAINITLRDNKKAILAYVLTNLRLIKIEIDIFEDKIESSSFPLNTIIGVERKLLADDRIEFGIAFQNGSIGLRYSAEDKKITDFFQQIEQPRPSMGAK